MKARDEARALMREHERRLIEAFQHQMNPPPKVEVQLVHACSPKERTRWFQLKRAFDEPIDADRVAAWSTASSQP